MTSDPSPTPTQSDRLGIRRPSPGGGFTLIELVTVLVIVAILAATAAPAMSSITTGRARLAADHLLHDLTFARQRALATGETCWVVIDAGANSWEILVEDPLNPGRAGAQPIVDPATGRPYAVTLGSGADPYPDVDILSVTFDGGAEVGFDWVGRPFNSTESPLAAFGRVTLSGGSAVWTWPGTGHSWIP